MLARCDGITANTNSCEFEYVRQFLFPELPDENLHVIMLASTPVVKDLVLVGGGHSHIEVLRRFGMKPLPGVRLTLVTRDVHTPYSGMLPGYVSGFYTYDDCHVDLARLSKFANTRFIHAEARGIDTRAQKVLLRGRPSISYDVLSINVGITPAAVTVPGAYQYTTGVKPIDRFVVRFEELLQRVRQEEGALRVVVVGGGAAGVELACALQHRFAEERRKAGKEVAALVSLVSRGPILQQLAPYARNAFLSLLKARGVALYEVEGGVLEVMPSLLELGDGSQLPYHECLWCTQAGAAPWVAGTGLPTDDGGFLAVNEFLQCEGGLSNVFAAGDIASFSHAPRPKAGVFAVRAGGPLAENLRRQLLGQPLHSFTPQRTYLNLLSAGDKYAVGVKGWLGFQGAWCWGLKDRIDTSFMRKYSTELDMESSGRMGWRGQEAQALRVFGSEAEAVTAAAKMRCGGCGGKVGASILSRVLQRLRADCDTQARQAKTDNAVAAHGSLSQSPKRSGVLLGLESPDDAAVIRPPPPGYVTVHTVDYFRSMVDDPYTFGMVTANHALSDCFAMGAKPIAAMAIAAVPFATAGKMEDDLYQMMAGASRVLESEHCQLVGGHSSEGAELGLGFSVYGEGEEAKLMSKAGMKAGDALVLTKPLGTGTILAAHMKGEAKGQWVDGAIASMLQSNGKAAEILQQYGVTACTDVTGFGLLGHLYELAQASNVSVVVDTNSVLLLPGAYDTALRKHKSSLHDENAKVASEVEGKEEIMDPMWALLIDPQTSGGLLASVSEEDSQNCVAALKKAGYESTLIGNIQLKKESAPFICLH